MQLRSAIERVTSLMLARLVGEDVLLTFSPARDVGRIEADVGQIEQILTNLVVNARDAMPDGGAITIETRAAVLDAADVAAAPHAHAGPHVAIVVRDTGTGMPDDVLSRIFEPFFTTKEEGRGTGLGLAIVYEIVQQAGGILRVASEPGRGSTFEGFLPRRDGEIDSAGAHPVQAGGPPSAPRTVLFVEDDEGLRSLARRSLEQQGYVVETAADTEEALRALARPGARFDIVLTDVILPGPSGAKLAAELRQKLPHLPIVFMSGYTDEELARHGITRKDVHFIAKPFGPEQLRSSIEAVLADTPQ